MNIPDTIKGKAIRRAKYYAGVLLFIIAALWIWTFQLQLSHFRRAEDYFAKSDLKLAMREYDSALHLFTPFSPLIEKSAERLWHIGEEYESMDQPEWALIAYSSLRSSFYASQSFYVPGKDWIYRCEEKMAKINVKLLEKTGDLRQADAEKEKAKFLHLYRYKGSPNVSWFLVACFGMAGWVSSAAFLCMGTSGPDGKLRLKRTVYGCLSFAASFAVWVMALLTA